MHDLSQHGPLPGDPTGLAGWPTAPGAVIGHRKDGRPIRLLAGGAPDDGADDTGSDGGGDGRDGGEGDGGREHDPDDGAEDDDTGSGSGRDGEPGKGRAKRRNRDATHDGGRDGRRDGGRGNDDDHDPDDEGVDSRARKVIDRVRGEFKDERAKRQTAEQAAQAAEAKAAEAAKAIEEMRAQQAERDEQLAKLLGLKEDDTPPDPAKLAEQLTAAQTAAEKAEADRQAAIADRDEQLRLARIENAVLVAAPDLDADPKALADSKRFAKSIADLDPDGDDFTEQVEVAITKAIADDSRLKRARPAERSSGGDFGGTRKPRQRPTSIAEAVNRAYAKT